MNANSTTGNMPANGDATAPTTLDIDQLYRTHKQHLLRFVQRYVRNTDDAEDVVQNTFIEAMRC
jgi:DNA-directed RNA polymerase specialized sigma24 family protein